MYPPPCKKKTVRSTDNLHVSNYDIYVHSVHIKLLKGYFMCVCVCVKKLF